jgi:FkbM family methyltransferase
LARFPESHGVLCEPTPDTHAAVQQRFRDNPRLQVAQLALSDSPRLAPLFTGGPAYTNSLLPSVDGTGHSTTVTVETLDRLRDTLLLGPGLDLIKIDAQGHDLHILRGAATTLRRDAPVVLVEVIFAALYDNQDSYFDILQHMKDWRYELAGIHNAHASATGVLAFADCLFLPAALHARVRGGSERFTCLDADELLQQNRLLQKACEERLELIHQLHQTAEERLQVIHKLDAQVKAVQAKKRWWWRAAAATRGYLSRSR